MDGQPIPSQGCRLEFAVTRLVVDGHQAAAHRSPAPRRSRLLGGARDPPVRGQRLREPAPRGGSRPRQNPQADVSQASIMRSRGPQARPYSSRVDGGSSPIEGTSSQSYATGGIARRTAAVGMARPPSRAATGPDSTAGARGGCRITRASSRAVADGWTGPSGASIEATYASNASTSAGSRASGTPNSRAIGSVSA